MEELDASFLKYQSRKADLKTDGGGSEEGRGLRIWQQQRTGRTWGRDADQEFERVTLMKIIEVSQDSGSQYARRAGKPSGSFGTHGYVINDHRCGAARK
ncbi:hypothetical protein DPMN_018201 [Dreissena polymorpha]|uniref:Uncharacterized protein n=1 Tax=Dreissena polymorpha TaxID=45954 RepID=A0A9D4S659_DREPO|nr:hypothetical protein DPMN_018201 [Dreissena polymorpha]